MTTDQKPQTANDVAKLIQQAAWLHESSFDWPSLVKDTEKKLKARRMLRKAGFNEPVRSVAQAPRPTVLVYGLIGPQSATLKELLKPYPIDVTCVERSAIPPKATFDFVLLSRWVSHADVARLSKHNTKVQVAYGWAATMASHIIDYFNLDDSGETGD